ncbi:MAG: radical SAM protein [Heliobacteriaceae bacterium]|nr:radical SAM protein [Heliobacteriaceae bacterium]
MGVRDAVEKGLKDTVANAAAEMLERGPEKNIDKMVSLLHKVVKDEDFINRLDFIYNEYRTNPANQKYIHDLLEHTDKKCLQKLFVNFFTNAAWYGINKRARYMVEEDTKIPFVILLSPSMRCNLRCTGCYAGDYSKKDDIPYAEVDRLVGEARDLGIYYMGILGGEPFLVDYMLDIYEKYNDVLFTPFSNGTLFDEKLADRLQKLGNVVTMFSLEGLEPQTDARRGPGTFAKVMQAMDLLRERGVLFGVSAATSRANLDSVVSDAFVDLIIAKGAKMIWYFMYMPVGDQPEVSLMLTPEQRLYLGQKTRQIRTAKPIFAIDFFNDAPYVGGCVAGKYYCHINAREDVEPCVFTHFACDNVKNKPLIEVFKAPFFKEIRRRQPYNRNLLQPCMMIDNPGVIREVVAKTGAYATHQTAERMVKDPAFMGQLDRLAADFQPAAEKAWQQEFHGTGNYTMSKG